MHESELARIRQEKKAREKRPRVKSVEERIEEVLSIPQPQINLVMLEIDSTNAWRELAILLGDYIAKQKRDLQPLIAELARERDSRPRAKPRQKA